MNFNLCDNVFMFTQDLSYTVIDKECPFGDVCIFEHEESERCKCGKGCERQMCMCTHDEEDENDNDDDDGNRDEDVKKLNVLEKVKMAAEKCNNLIDKCSLKCKNCDFEAKEKNGLVMHTKAKHLVTRISSLLINLSYFFPF